MSASGQSRRFHSARDMSALPPIATRLLYCSEPLGSLHRNLLARRHRTIRTRRGNMAKLMSKSELIQKIADLHPNAMTRKDVKGVIESLAEVGYKELKK